MRDHLGNTLLASNLEFARGVQLLDDCEGTCNWIAAGTGGDYVVTYATAAACFGLKGLHLATRTTDTAADDVVSATKRFNRSPNGLLVARGKLMCPDWTLVKYLSIALNVYHISRLYKAIFRYTPATDVHAYLNTAGTYTTITLMVERYTNGTWLTWELSINWTQLKYWGLTLADYTPAVSTAGMYNSGAGTTMEAELILSIQSVGAAVATAYFDAISVLDCPDI